MHYLHSNTKQQKANNKNNRGRKVLFGLNATAQMKSIDVLGWRAHYTDCCSVVLVVGVVLLVGVSEHYFVTVAMLFILI